MKLAEANRRRRVTQSRECLAASQTRGPLEPVVALLALLFTSLTSLAALNQPFYIVLHFTTRTPHQLDTTLIYGRWASVRCDVALKRALFRAHIVAAAKNVQFRRTSLLFLRVLGNRIAQRKRLDT